MSDPTRTRGAGSAAVLHLGARARPQRRRRLLGALLAAAVLLASAALFAPVARADAGDGQGEHFSLAAGDGRVVRDASASQGHALLIWTDAVAQGEVTAVRDSARLRVWVRGQQCQGAPRLVVAVDGERVISTAVPSTRWTPVTAGGWWAAGRHAVSVAFEGDLQAGGCDRNLLLDRVVFRAAAPAAPAAPPAAPPAPSGPSAPWSSSAAPGPATGDPLAGARFWVDPDNDARREIARRPSDTAAVAQLSKIADTPGATWLGDWVPTAQVGGRVAAITTRAAADGSVPVLVLYAIPGRDCGSYSAGGLPGPDAYGSWVRAVAGGIGARRTVVVLEPDALAEEDCLSAAGQTQREGMLRDAVAALGSASGAVTYLDAGNSHWMSATTMATRLRAAGVDQARGFSLDVANFNRTADEEAYGEDLSSALGGAGYVVDTSRNGNGPADGPMAWCNPPGRALGARPSAQTTAPHADALLWIKTVGDSDGDCGRGEPSAGAWWADYAIGVATRSA